MTRLEGMIKNLTEKIDQVDLRLKRYEEVMSLVSGYGDRLERLENQIRYSTNRQIK